MPAVASARSALKITFHGREALPPHGAAIAVPLGAGGSFPAVTRRIDAKLEGLLKDAASRAECTGAAGEVLEVFTPQESGLSRVFLYGTTSQQDLPEGKASRAGRNEKKTFPEQPVSRIPALSATLAAEKAGAILYAKAVAAKVQGKELWLVSDSSTRALSVAEGALLRSWRFTTHHTRGAMHGEAKVQALRVVTTAGRGLERSFVAYKARARGNEIAKALVSESPNWLYPESFVAVAKRDLPPLGVKVSSLGETEMRRLNMGALLGVAQGSVRKPRLLVMEYKGAPASEKPVLLVGKGVCFDTGGISLKPPKGMEDMKYDMGGAAAVTGAIAAIAGRKARANVVALAGLVENMPDGNAQRPSDIVYSASGQTIEVLNTDAEGRLVLADALWYAQKYYKPRAIVDLATLTGAMVVALGSTRAGCFANDDRLARALLAAGERVAEPLWRFPLEPDYDKLLDSPAADMQNISPGYGAGSITAAQFLQRFVDRRVPWAHLDIAGVAWRHGGSLEAAKGATGYGVRLLNEYVLSTERGSRR